MNSVEVTRNAESFAKRNSVLSNSFVLANFLAVFYRVDRESVREEIVLVVLR